MSRKTYQLDIINGHVFTVYPRYFRYQYDGGLAVLLFDIDEDGYEEQFGDVTRCIPFALHSNEKCAFVDENNIPGIGKWLEANGLAKPTGISVRSGHCVYPEYEFNLDGVTIEG